MIEATITIKRDKGEAKTYQLKQVEDSRGGKHKFAPAGESADLCGYGVIYVKAKREVVKEAPVKKS